MGPACKKYRPVLVVHRWAFIRGAERNSESMSDRRLEDQGGSSTALEARAAASAGRGRDGGTAAGAWQVCRNKHLVLLALAPPVNLPSSQHRQRVAQRTRLGISAPK